jgi:hypothetical protein
MPFPKRKKTHILAYKTKGYFVSVMLGDGRIKMVEQKKTVIFEKKYGTDIKKYNTTEQVDSFIEDRLDRKLNVKRVETNVVARRGSILPLNKLDINKKLDALLR